MMAEISSIPGSTTSADLAKSLTSDSSALGKDEFLTLMVEQLKNQDPMDPADATEFTAQLAQFSSLEQLFNVNDNLESMGNTSAEVQRLSALAMIGTEVVTTSSEFKFNGEPIKLGYELDAPADSGSLYIRDAAGNNVGSFPLENMEAGTHFLEWDGTDGNGKTLIDGNYTLGVSAFNGDDAVAATSLLRSRVIGVDMADGTETLVTDSGDYRYADVQSVRGL
ncbi:MAG: flagellar hook capping protein [Desulfobacteraceae bacterium 4572_35.2]|nr:MAG: flagellar hook capping protein [Desulfobacteraceae bacterium 4572_35.2]